jgi:deoxyribonuclease V
LTAAAPALALRHDWAVTTGQAREIQRKLARKLSLKDTFDRVALIAGVDVSVRNRRGCAACVVMSFPELEILEEVVARGRIDFPYVPGLLTFREGPLVLQAFAKLKREPDVLIFDGQGIAHPVSMGLASHMGVLLERPTIGCAKSRLVGEYEDPGIEKGSASDLLFEGRRVGSVVRTRTGVKPVFVSPGNRIGFDSSVRLVLDCARRYRLPEPTRMAHLTCGRWSWN